MCGNACRTVLGPATKMSDIHHVAFYRAICLFKVQAGVRVGIIAEAKVNITCDCLGLTLSQYYGKIIGQ